MALMAMTARIQLVMPCPLRHPQALGDSCQPMCVSLPPLYTSLMVSERGDIVHLLLIINPHGNYTPTPVLLMDLVDDVDVFGDGDMEGRRAENSAVLWWVCRGCF